MYFYHNPLPSFCGGMLKFPIFFHRRHFGWILFLLNITSFIFERFPTFCDRKVSFTQVLLFILVFVFYFFAAVFQIYLVLSLPLILHPLFDSRSSGFFLRRIVLGSQLLFAKYQLLLGGCSQIISVVSTGYELIY